MKLESTPYAKTKHFRDLNTILTLLVLILQVVLLLSNRARLPTALAVIAMRTIQFNKQDGGQIPKWAVVSIAVLSLSAILGFAVNSMVSDTARQAPEWRMAVMAAGVLIFCCTLFAIYRTSKRREALVEYERRLIEKQKRPAPHQLLGSGDRRYQ